MHESVCVYVWDMLLKGQNVLTIPFLFYSLFGVRIKIGEKIDIFLQIHFVSVLLMFFIIVVVINKVFKLFKLVLVVYCDSCCHWWYPENSGNPKNRV